MTAPKLGPLLNPSEFTPAACRSMLRGYWGTNPESRLAHMLFPVQVPKGAFPELWPGFVPIEDYGMPSVAKLHADLAPEGCRVVGVAGRFLFIEPADRVKPAERVLRIHPDHEIEYREMPNFVGTQRYGTRKPLPNEIGILVKAVTTTYGIGHEKGRTYGDVICRVECSDPVAKERP